MGIPSPLSMRPLSGRESFASCSDASLILSNATKDTMRRTRGTSMARNQHERREPHRKPRASEPPNVNHGRQPRR